MNKVGDVITDPKLGRGEWVVIATVMAGGGIAMFNDRYPDGHRLTLRKLKRGTNEINWKVPERQFYQSGCFVDEVMLPSPKLVRRLA